MLITAIRFRGKSHAFNSICFVFVAILAFPLSAFSHGGGLDSSGCHNDRKRGGYHCHRSSYTPPAAPSYNSLYSSSQGGSSNSTNSYLTGSIPVVNATTATNADQSEKISNLEKLLVEQASKIKELKSAIIELKSKEIVAVKSCENFNKESMVPTEIKSKELLSGIIPISSPNEKFKVKVKTVRSNIRLKPVLENNVIGTVDQGDVLSVISESGKFYLVNTSGGAAYIHKTTVEALGADTNTSTL